MANQTASLPWIIDTVANLKSLGLNFSDNHYSE